MGCKSLIYYTSNYRNQRDKETAPRPQPGMNEEVITAMLKLTNGEVLVVQNYILAAIPAMKLLKEEGPCAYSLPGDKTHAEHYRDALTYFAASFTSVSFELYLVLFLCFCLIIEVCSFDRLMALR